MSTAEMIPLATPNLCGREGEYLAECVRSTFVSSVGPFVTRFEADVAAASDAASAVATSAGTTGLQAALVAAGVMPGDLVIMPSLTFIATLSATHWSGATPWLFDVDPRSWTLDAAQVEQRLIDDTIFQDGMVRHRVTGQRVAAILPVYTLGTPADMDALVAVAAPRNLPIIADAAAALGATYKGRPLAKMGAIGSMISFNGNKTVTAGGGGAVVGDDPVFMKRLRHLTTTARVGSDYLHDEIGFNFRMTNLQAAVGVAQMEFLDFFLERKRAIRARYDEAFAGLAGTRPFPQPDWGESACWFSGLVLDGRTKAQVDAVIVALRQSGVDARPFWRPMHEQPPAMNALRTDMPTTDELWFRVLTLPCSTDLTEADQARVIDAVRRATA
jgi:perosamine synthetase